MNELFSDLFIFEMANNHQGSVEHGLRIIEAMGKISRKYGIKGAVKFQYRDLQTLIHPDYRNRDDVKHIPRFLSTCLTPGEMLGLVNAVRDQGMITIATPFDEPSVQLCIDHGIQILKVASPSATDWPLIEAVAETKRPVILSTAGVSIYEIDNLVSFLTHRDISFAMLHCVGVYPAPDSMLQLSFINRLINRYPGITIGYSGHEDPDNVDAVKIAVSKGAAILERHVGVPTATIKLNKYSMDPEQTDRWVASALAAREMCGPADGRKVSQEEFESLMSLKRGVYAARDIRKRTRIKREHVFFAMPCGEGQTTSGEFGQKRSVLIASKDYKRGEPVSEHRQPDTISLVRGIIHDAKGMLHESHVKLGKGSKIELSHHYGIEHFRQTGALIVNVINREYCKKLVVLLPGQKHPNHYHKIKEETFHLLWGDLQLNLSGIIHKLSPDDLILIERGAWHSFTTGGGAIFEEISTTHIYDDSYYEDDKISKLDPMLRKTTLDNW